MCTPCRFFATWRRWRSSSAPWDRETTLDSLIPEFERSRSGNMIGRTGCSPTVECIELDNVHLEYHERAVARRTKSSDNAGISASIAREMSTLPLRRAARGAILDTKCFDLTGKGAASNEHSSHCRSAGRYRRY